MEFFIYLFQFFEFICDFLICIITLFVIFMTTIYRVYENHNLKSCIGIFAINIYIVFVLSIFCTFFGPYELQNIAFQTTISISFFYMIYHVILYFKEKSKS